MRTGLAVVLAIGSLRGGDAKPDSQLQDRPAVMPLSLKRAVEIATAPEGNARVQIADELIKQAESRVSQARAALLPNFDGTLSEFSRTTNLESFGFKFPSTPGFTFPTVVGPYNVFDLRMNGSQSVFDLPSIRRFQSAKTTVQATKADARGTRDQIADQVSRAYLIGLRAEATLDTARSNVELSEALVRLATSQKAAGTGTGIEITRAQVQLANDKQRLTVAQNDRERSHLQLMRVLGLKFDGGIALTDKLAYKPLGEVAADPAVKVALDGRAELKAQQDRELSTRINYGATKWERLPSLAFSGDYGTIGGGIDNAIPTHSYGVTVRLPIFDGGRRDARRVESESQWRVETLRTRDLKEQIELDVRLAIDALRSADAQVEVAKEGLDLAQKELEQARRRYEAGVTNSIEVTDAQTRLQRARDNQIAALFAHNLARIDLNTASGTIQDLVNSF